MKSPIEDRLRHTLRRQAESTVAPSDAWERIVAATPGQRRRPHAAGLVLVGACAVVVVMILAASMRGDGTSRVHVTRQPPRLHLVPSGLDARFQLVYAAIDPEGGAPGHGPAVRVFGRRAPDGIALEASIVVKVPADPLEGSEPEPAPLVVAGEEMTVYRDAYGRRTLGWNGDDGSQVGLTGFGVSDDELAAAAASLRRGAALSADPQLPAGFVAVYSGRAPVGPHRLTDQNWEAGDGDSFSVTVVDIPGVSIDDVARELPGGSALGVRGTTGIFSDREGAILTWIERPDTLVSVMSPELDERQLRDIAEGLRSVDELRWRELYDSAERHKLPRDNFGAVPARPPSGVDGGSFFVVRPVLRRSAPPCAIATTDRSSTVADIRDGRETACYEVGAPGLDANDVIAATARQDRSTASWQVEFTLSSTGSGRFQALARMVGTGGQLAFLVDGRLVNAPVIATPTLGDTGLLSALDEQTARSLAVRLGA